jgi:hypothetical protein
MVVKKLLRQYQDPQCWNLPQLYQVDIYCILVGNGDLKKLYPNILLYKIIEIFHFVMSFSSGFSNNKIGSSILAHA